MIVFLIIIIVEMAVGLHLLNDKQETNENILQEEQQDSKAENSIEKVRERNNFYTVSACIDKYLSYLYDKDIDTLYSYLDKEYIEQNGITKNNILEKIGKIDTYKIFSAKEMYEQKITDGITKYYAYGVIKEDVADGEALEEEFYIAIKIDSKNSTFSVLPNTYID